MVVWTNEVVTIWWSPDFIEPEFVKIELVGELTDGETTDDEIGEAEVNWSVDEELVERTVEKDWVSSERRELGKLLSPVVTKDELEEGKFVVSELEVTELINV